MLIKNIVVGELETNCYLVVDGDSKNCFIVDPGSEPQKIELEIKLKRFHVKGIINTHSHVDHIGGNAYLKSKYSCPIYIHSADAISLPTPEGNLSSMLFPGGLESPPADKLLHDGDTITDGRIKLKVMHTPGHTKGSMCLLAETFAITGDTLFYESVGRVDLPGGNDNEMNQSIEKLKKLPHEMRIYPGHGEKSTIKHELENNPFF